MTGEQVDDVEEFVYQRATVDRESGGSKDTAENTWCIPEIAEGAGSQGPRENQDMPIHIKWVFLVTTLEILNLLKPGDALKSRKLFLEVNHVVDIALLNVATHFPCCVYLQSYFYSFDIEC